MSASCWPVLTAECYNLQYCNKVDIYCEFIPLFVLITTASVLGQKVYDIRWSCCVLPSGESHWVYIGLDDLYCFFVQLVLN